MYLNLQSFNARCKYEDLNIFGAAFDTESCAKKGLEFIKQFNVNKNVVYSCCEFEDNTIDVYKNVQWVFGYEDINDVYAVRDGLRELFTCVKTINTLSKEMQCPFMNKGEVI